MRTKIIVVGLGLITSLVWVSLAWAAKPVQPAADNPPPVELSDGVRYEFGQDVRVTDQTNGDLIIAGGNVVVRGEVQGDVLVAGGNVRLEAHVAGNVRVIGGNVELTSTVGHNVLAIAGTVNLTSTSHIFGHLTAAAGQLTLSGVIDGSVRAASGDVTLDGTVQGPSDFWLGRAGKLKVLATAVALGPFTYQAGQAGEVSSAAKFSQPPQFKQLERRASGYSSQGWWWGHLGSLFGLLVLGMVLVKLLPRKLGEVAEEALTHPWTSLGWGAVFMIVVPFITILLLITVIGIPLAVITIALYVVGLVVSQAIAGVVVAWYIKAWPQLKIIKSWPLLAQVSLGIVIWRLAVNLPYAGGIVAIVGTLWAWGALVKIQKRTLAQLN